MKIVTLTLSAAFDVHCEANSLEIGKENFASITERNAGGKGINISRALNAFGVKNTAVAVLGEENSKEFLNKLNSDGVTVEKITVPGRIRENLTVHTGDGKETRISFGSTNVSGEDLSAIEKLTDGILGESDVLTLTGSIPHGISVDAVKEYVKRLKLKGVRVIVDSRTLSLSDIFDMKPFLIKPNEQEIEEYVGKEIRDLDEARLVAKELQSQGIENVMITLGKKGAVLANKDGVVSAIAPSVRVASTIGAGDSTIAGFIYALCISLPSDEVLKTSVAFGTAACLKNGTEPPDIKDVLKILENGILVN